jgi:hypothetical protein
MESYTCSVCGKKVPATQTGIHSDAHRETLTYPEEGNIQWEPVPPEEDE